MANSGNCEISFLRGTRKPYSFWVFFSESDGQCQQNAVWWFFSFLYPFALCLWNLFFFWAMGCCLMGLFSQLLCPIKLDP